MSRWEEVARRYTPPCDRHLKTNGWDAQKVVERAMHGFTTVELRNKRTGDIRFVTTLGDSTTPNPTPSLAPSENP